MLDDITDGILSLSIHPTGKLLFVLTEHNHYYLYNLINNTQLYKNKLKDIATSILFDPSGEYYLLVYYHKIEIYEVNTGNMKLQFDMPCRVNKILFYNTQYMVCGCEDGRIRCFTMDGEDISPQEQSVNGRIKDMSILGDILISITSSGYITLWYIEEKSIQHVLTNQIIEGYRVNCMACCN